MSDNSFVFMFGEFEVSESDLRVARAGETLPLEPKTLRVLLYLLRNQGRLVTKQELLDHVWGDVAVVESSLTRAVALIRKALDDDMRDPKFIATVPKAGYRFICSVETRILQPAGGLPVSAPVPLASPGKRQTRTRLWVWPWVGLIASGALTVSGLALWYLLNPLPAPYVSEYTRITHDGHVGNVFGTDGNRVYFDSDTWDSINQVGIGGGEITPVPTGSIRAAGLDVSSDGSELLIWSAEPHGLWTTGTVGGPPRFIREPHGTDNYALSPDKRFIACSDSDGNLFLIPTDGTEIRRLLTAKGNVIDIAWSPDGNRLRFTRDNVIWEIDSSGSNSHQLLPSWNGPAGQCCGRWTPDGNFFVFLAGRGDLVGSNGRLSTRAGGVEQIWALDERHSRFRRTTRNPVQLTSGPTYWDTLVPGRDSGHIFARGTIARGELVRVDANSNQLQSHLGGISAESLSFSRDGKQLAYVSYPDGVLWRAKSDGTGRIQLTSPPVYPLACTWSQDGKRILFTAQRDPLHYGLYVVSAEGGRPDLVVPGDDVNGATGGYWSPDGRKIVYADNASSSLHIFDLDRHIASAIPGSEGLFAPSWSPDGNYIVALKEPGNALQLLNVKTGNWSPIAQHSSGGWAFMNWSHDGHFLFALNSSSIYRFEIPGGRPVSVAKLDGVHLAGVFGAWFGLDPNDGFLLLRDIGARDIYSLTLAGK